MSAGSISSLFPDRPIRPLPKRRLRERLSPEVADSIQYPPAPKSTAPLFYYPYNLREDDPEVGYPGSRERAVDIDPQHAGTNGAGVESDEDEAGSRLKPVFDRPLPDPGRLSRLSPKVEHGRHVGSQLPRSAASSVDGYDAFENTNNKKKRKIPAAGDTAPGGNHGPHDSAAGLLASAGKLGRDMGDAAVPTSSLYYGSSGFPSGAQNVPGPGRGRYGRIRNGRSPLRALSDSTNNWAGRNGKLRPLQWSYPTMQGENTGIISTAIANAEKLPPQQGQENVSLLHQQQQAIKRNPALMQFTFTCDSQVPGTLAWPGSDRRTTATQHSVGPPQTNENWARPLQDPQAAYSPHTTPQTMDQGSQTGTSRPAGTNQNPPAASQKKSRKTELRELDAQARTRRRQTQQQNRHHPPKQDEFWLCYYCEYEAIYGEPPRALIEHYERKERKQRQLEEERKAKLAKKLNSLRKGNKKNGKAPAKSNNAPQDPSQPPAGHNSPMNRNQSSGTQSEDFYDDYDDEDPEDYDPDADPIQEPTTSSLPRGTDGAADQPTAEAARRDFDRMDRMLTAAAAQLN